MTVPDPRPRPDPERPGTFVGARCLDCGYPSWWAAPRCPACNGTFEPATFGPRGIVWSSTVVRVPVPGRTPPYALAYVDLDHGPRLLVHVRQDADDIGRVAPGTPVEIVGTSDTGDPLVEVVGA